MEVLAPLRSECKQCHFKLQSFYDECSKLKYLTSLVQIPNIGHLPPDFLNQGPPTQKPKTAPTTVDTSRNEKEEREELERYERENRKRLEEQEYMKKREEELRLQEQQKLMEQQKRLQEQQRARDEENERMRQQQYLQQQQFQIQQQMMSAQQELEYHRQQSLKDRELLNKYDTKVRELQSELGNMSLMQANTSSVKALEDEIAKWKQKYETLTKLYGQLRKEHLDLLTKLKTIKDNELKVTNQSKQNTEELNTLLKKKADELTTVLVERNRLKEELGGIKGGYESEISRLRQELESTKKSLLEISQNQGDAVQKLVKDFQLDQSKLESTINSKQREITILTSQLGDVVSALEKSQMVRF